MSDDKYNFRLGAKEERQEILDYLVEYFKNEEPLNRAAGMSEEEFFTVAGAIVDGCLQEPFTTVVRCKRTGDIVAVLLNSISNRTDGKHELKLGNPDPRVSAFGWILNELHNSFFDLVPEEVKKVIHMEILSVSTPHQRQGIASKMMNFSYPREKLEKHEIDGIMSETTSLANQTLQAKRGFKLLHSMYAKTNVVFNGSAADGIKIIIVKADKMEENIGVGKTLKVIHLADLKDEEGQQLLRTHDGTEISVLNWIPTSDL